MTAQPVGVRSRLVRCPEVTYSEVDGHSVLCLSTQRNLFAPSPLTVTLWSELDGRPLGEVFETVGLTAGTVRREAIEVLRRLKANDLIEDLDDDADPDDIPEIPDDGGLANRLKFAASVDPDTNGADSGKTDSVVLTLERATGSDDQSIVEVRFEPTASGDTALAATVEGCHVAGARIDLAASGLAVPAEQRGSASLDPVAAMACWVVAVVDTKDLTDPGIVDALAILAEAVPVATFEPVPVVGD